ncbi:MAG: capsular polysaccharide biosynthesis protein [Pseudomonadota bacterium]
MAQRRLGVLSLGFFREKTVRRILTLAGWEVVAGLRGVDAVGVWGRGRPARRGQWAARRFGLPLLTVEEAFLRGLKPGRSGSPPLGLLLDDLGVHFDAARPSRLEQILAQDDLADGAAALAQWRRLGLSKLNHWADMPAPAPGFVLVVDQLRGDAAIAGGGADAESFRAMLAAALAENPGRRVLIRPHPSAGPGNRRGHFEAGVVDGAAADGRVAWLSPEIAPHRLLAAAHRVYVVTSQLGFEAILAGHRPRVFGLPFYAGWGLADEARRTPRRTRHLNPAALFSGTMLRYPVWYDPFADRLCDFSTAAVIASEEAAAYRTAPRPPICVGVRAWKRPVVRRFLDGPGGVPVFAKNAASALERASRTGRPLAVWASRTPPDLHAACTEAGVALLALEDGFLRSLGLGARLVPPASLVVDDLGIHFDPSQPSRLEALIAGASDLPEHALARAAALRRRIVLGGHSKYGAGSGGDVPEFPQNKPLLLVAGQVADDASLRLGATGAVRDNRGLLAAARAANPDAMVIYRPHPDVSAGLRPGGIDAADLADCIVADGDPAALLARIHMVWTISSQIGFEALLRGIPVTCLGAPFYAGWGLTCDKGPVPARRWARPGLDGLVHAALIDYPRYRDPITGRACSPERLLARLASGDRRLARPASPALRLLARLQDRLAPAAGLWR